MYTLATINLIVFLFYSLTKVGNTYYINVKNLNRKDSHYYPYQLDTKLSYHNPKKQNLYRYNNIQLTSNSLILPSDSWGIWAIITTSAASSLYLERTKIGKSLSGPVTAMLLTTLLTIIGILPMEGSIHITSLQGFVVKLATPLLLLGANLIEIFKETGTLLKAFLFGTLGTLFGSFIGYLVFAKQIQLIGSIDDGWKIAGCITAKNIGGGLNYMAVADILKVSPSTISTGLAIDNILGLIYFPIISYLGGLYNNRHQAKLNELNSNELSDHNGNNILLTNNINTNDHNIISPPPPTTNTNILNDQSDEIRYMGAISIGFIITFLSELLSKQLHIPAIALSSISTVTIASIFSKQIKPFIQPGELLGKLLLLVFCSSIGNASGSIFKTLSDTSSGAIALLRYGIILYILHFIIIFTFGKLFKIEIPDILLGSNANIGNAATASALAISMNWKSRLLPAILVGNLGNFMGTFGGLWISTMVFKPIYMKIAGFIIAK